MKLMNIVRSAPKRLYAVVAVAAAVVTVPAALLAWGPDRPTYTIDNPADHVTFNSITNNPNIGDERNFVGIREAGTQSLWSDNMNVEKGKTYTVRLFVHNNAATSLNASGEGVAHDVTAKVNLPTTTAKSIQVDGQISASNAAPNAVWDQANFTSAQDFNLAVVPGSLKYENNAGTFALPESLLTSTGAKLGYNTMDGNLPGCFQYSGYVTFQVTPQFAPVNDFTMSKQVRKAGETAWAKTVATNPGDTVEYMISYKDTGETRQNNVVVNDYLPQGMTYVPGSSYLRNGTNPTGLKISDNVVTDTGVNIGDYNPQAAGYVKFSAKVNSADSLPCGPQTLKNKARVTVDGGYKEDTADVTVNGKDCPQPQPIQVCELSTKKVITIKESDFDSSKHSKVLADCKETPAPGQVEVCNPTTGEIITVDEKDKDNYAPVNSDKCKDIKVCVVSTKTTATIKGAEFDANKHSTNMNDCKDAPATVVTELPQTGVADVVAKLAGAISLAGAAAYYIASRRQA